MSQLKAKRRICLFLASGFLALAGSDIAKADIYTYGQDATGTYAEAVIPTIDGGTGNTSVSGFSDEGQSGNPLLIPGFHIQGATLVQTDLNVAISMTGQSSTWRNDTGSTVNSGTISNLAGMEIFDTDPSHLVVGNIFQPDYDNSYYKYDFPIINLAPGDSRPLTTDTNYQPSVSYTDTFYSSLDSWVTDGDISASYKHLTYYTQTGNLTLVSTTAPQISLGGTVRYYYTVVPLPPGFLIGLVVLVGVAAATETKRRNAFRAVSSDRLV